MPEVDKPEPPDIDIRAIRAGGRAFLAPADDDPPKQLGGTGLDCDQPDEGGTSWAAGNIISDAVFYNSHTMDAAAIATFLEDKGRSCTAGCLKDLAIATSTVAADRYCTGYQGGADEPIAQVFAKVTQSCGINPQVLLVMLEKESSLVTATSPASSRFGTAFGYACPDSGPGGSAACSPDKAGMWAQTWGFAHQLAKYRVEIPAGKFGKYRPGETVDILWNVAESGCGASPVHIKNVATASLYTYTPYQPNAASLAAYPGTGDTCSSYGNRNFFFLFNSWFGPTGGGTSASEDGLGSTAVGVRARSVQIPSGPDVAPGAAGRTIEAPNPLVAGAIAAGMTWLGTPYSWGGGNRRGPTRGICGSGPARGDCRIIGFDCSGLTQFVAGQFGASLPRHSGDQRAGGRGVPWGQAQPGDIIGYSGHVAIYLGEIDGQRYMLEAPESGKNVRVTTVRTGADKVVYRYWK